VLVKQVGQWQYHQYQKEEATIMSNRNDRQTWSATRGRRGASSRRTQRRRRQKLQESEGTGSKTKAKIGEERAEKGRGIVRKL
jgi:hypothetical protein